RRRATLRRPGQALFLSCPLDDHVTIAVTDGGASRPLLLPQLRQELLQLLVLGRKLRVVPVRERMKDIGPPVREPVDLLPDLCQGSHDRYNERLGGSIP